MGVLETRIYMLPCDYAIFLKFLKLWTFSINNYQCIYSHSTFLIYYFRGRKRLVLLTKTDMRRFYKTEKGKWVIWKGAAFRRYFYLGGNEITLFGQNDKHYKLKTGLSLSRRNCLKKLSAWSNWILHDLGWIVDLSLSFGTKCPCCYSWERKLAKWNKFLPTCFKRLSIRKGPFCSSFLFLSTSVPSQKDVKFWNCASNIKWWNDVSGRRLEIHHLQRYPMG